MATPNLGIPHIATNQNSKEATANTAFDKLDSALAGFLSINLADADLTLSADQAKGALAYEFSSVLTADRVVTVPATKKFYLIRNVTTGGSGFNVTVKTAAGSGVTIGNTAGLVLLYCDGVNVLASNVAGSAKIDVNGTATTTLNAAEASSFRVLLTDNIGTLTISNPTDGQRLTIHWVQDATGSRTVTFPASVKGGTAPSAGANTSSAQFFMYDATDSKWYAVAAGVTGM